jgi:hypothetical protein
VLSGIRSVSGLLLLGGITGCRDTRPVRNYSQPPVAVVASFKSFADSITPQLYRVLDSAGFHRGWDDKHETTGRAGPKLHVGQITDGEARAQVYEASLSIQFHSHNRGANGFPMPENLFLEFSTIRDAEVWALLTTEGYPFTLVTESNRNSLPLDAQVGVRNVFETRLEFPEWMAFKRAKLIQVGDTTGS